MSRIIWYPGYELPLKDIVRAENCHLYDTDGKQYIDLESGVWCTSVGHGHPRILRILAEQSALIAHTGFNYTCEVVEQAGREILSLAGFEDGHCIFLCSGSEAVEYGVRVAQAVSDRPLLMTMSDSYFGAYGSAMRRQRDEWFSFDWMECAGCPEFPGCDEQCEHWAAIPFDRIGGFLFEPGSSSGLVRFPPAKLINAIVHTVRETDGLVLVNEVTTGIGRTGNWFGYQHYDIIPDIIALGKGIGNGYPVSVTVLSSAVAGLLGAEPLKYAQSHQNDPLGAAVAMEVVRIVREEGLIERSREISDILLNGLAAIESRTGRIGEIRARGLMVAVELKDDDDMSGAIKTRREMMKRGFLVARRPGLGVLRIDPALTVEREDIEAFLQTFETVLAEA